MAMESKKNDIIPKEICGKKFNHSKDEEFENAANSGCCNPNRAVHRFLVLIFICLFGFASSFCLDAPGGLQDHFTDDLNMSTTKFSMLFAASSWAVVLTFLGGYLIDRVFGIRFGTILFLIILTIGQLIFAFGTTVNSFWVMLVGRFILGVGSEALAITGSKYAVRWFLGKELSTAFGLQLSFSRIGSTASYMSIEPIYQEAKKYVQSLQVIGAVMYFAIVTCVISLINAIILAWMDKRAKRILKRDKVSTVKETVKCSDIKSFKFNFWMVCLNVCTYYAAIFPFISLGKSFFEEKFGFSPESANQVNSIFYMISAFASPVCGFIVDKTGKNVSWVFYSSLLTIIAHIFLAFTTWNPYIGVCLMGVGFSIWTSSIWPIVALIIPEYQLGTAFGISQTFISSLLAVGSMLAGVIVDSAGYIMLEVFFIGWLSVAQLATIVIWKQDSKKDGYLNMTANQRRKFDRIKEIRQALDNSREHTNI